MNDRELVDQIINAGFSLFPCTTTKQPMTTNGFKAATNDHEVINRWLENPMGKLWGIPAEPNGFFAVDVDPEGITTWHDWIDANGLPEPTPWQHTPRGGAHYLFKIPEGVKVPNNAGKLAPGIDLRSTGYICTGNGYHWEIDINQPIAEAPAWLIEKVQHLNEKKSTQAPTIDHFKPDPAKSSDYWLKKALDTARPGNRNETGFQLALQLRDSGLSFNDAKRVMETYSARVAQTQENPYTLQEALITLESAFQAPPRQPAILYETYAVKTVDNGSQDEKMTQTIEPEQQEKSRKPTDDELAEIWIKKQAGETAYGLGEWRRYEKGIWNVVSENAIKHEIGQILIKAKSQGIRPTKHITSSVMEFAKLAVDVPDELWDANIDILPCKNGTLHIPTMTLRDHRPDDYATYGLPFDYDPKADAPVFKYVLGSTIKDAAEFLQEFAGYALTVDTRHELAIWFYGPSGSGKSTILEGLQTMLGNRATVLGLAEIERSRFALGDLKGKTMAVAAEQPAIYMSATHILNAIISGERITTERKFKDPITFIPKVKIIWAMNELPRISETGSGLFRRVKVIKFPPLAEANRDERIKEVIKTEGAGILNWALDGLKRLTERGRFEIPECVRQASKDFQRHNDIPSLFIEDQCELGDAYSEQAQTLYNAYKTWCLDNGHKPQSSTSLSAEWDRLGFTKYAAAGRRYYRGLRIKA